MRSARFLAAFVACGALFFAGPALGLTPEVKCQLKKIKEAGKYVKCLLKAEDKAIKAIDKGGNGLPDPAAITKCGDKFSGKWAKAEAKGGCGTVGDEADRKSDLETTGLTILNQLMPTTAIFQCDALGQSDCAGGEACYVNTLTEDPPNATCLNIGVALIQGQDCGFVNGCDIGHSCLLPKSPIDSQLTCTFHCNTQGGSPSCADGGNPGFFCVKPSIFYGDVDRTPANFGMCLDPNVWPGF